MTHSQFLTQDLKEAVRKRDWQIDEVFLINTLEKLLNCPSPSGMTDDVVNVTSAILEDLGIEYELTRRGAIRATLRGKKYSPDRAVVAHLDTLGAIVKNVKANGRLALAPIGHWSSRFAEGARVCVHADHNLYKGTILPLKASGHSYNEEIDRQPSNWDQVEIRLDEISHDLADLERLGINIGDMVTVNAQPEFHDNGFICSRHLDDKAGVAAILAAAKAILEGGFTLPLECHLLFTISEEVGVGASHVLHGDVAEMVSVDNGTNSPVQNSSNYGVTIALQDMTGPFDRHLSHKLISLARTFGIEHERDVFRYYRSDAAAALEAGNDIRTALICFACDGSHGWEQSHISSLVAVSDLLVAYLRSPLLFERDEFAIGPKDDFPSGEDKPDADQ